MIIQRKAASAVSASSAEVNDSAMGLRTFGNMKDPEVLVVCDAPKNYGHKDSRSPISDGDLRLFGSFVGQHGIPEEAFGFISPCGVVPKDIESSDKKKAEFLARYKAQFDAVLETVSPRVIVCFGNMALRQLYGKAKMVSKVRGIVDASFPKAPVMAMNSPANVLRVPELRDIFEADIRTMKRFRDTGYDAVKMLPIEKDYAWGRASELEDLLSSGNCTISIDSETTGLMWHRPDVFPITVQISRREGESRIYPIHYDYCHRHGMNYTVEEVSRIKELLTQVINRPDIKMVGHNLKFDHHMFKKFEGCEPKGWIHDTQLLAFMMDENMRSKDLAECTRRWVPSMAGYCVAPSTKILSSDMSHVEAGNIQVGDRLIGFDENCPPKKRRKMWTTVVEKTARLVKPCYRIKTSLGREMVLSYDHKLLTKSTKGGCWRWQAVESLAVGKTLMPFPWEEKDETFDGGYMSGIYDGEGFVTGTRQAGIRMGFAQTHGPVLDKCMSVLNTRGFGSWVSISHDKRKPLSNVVFSSWSAMRAAQMFRPIRLLGKEFWNGKALPRAKDGQKFDYIVEYEFVGEQEVVLIQTDRSTFIAEGICSHNSDSFDQSVDKERMIEVPPYDVLREDGSIRLHGMINYACGDTDACLRLYNEIKSVLTDDRQHGRRYVRVVMPAILTFATSVERFGIPIDTPRVEELSVELAKSTEDLYKSMMAAIPAAVKRKHLEKGLSFTRQDFMRDVLFSKDGFGLTPLVFTSTTENLPPEQRVPSTSVKDHLPYFPDNPFIQDYITYSKLQKLKTTYVDGFMDKYATNSIIHPTYMLHRTNTGRSACVRADTLITTDKGPKRIDQIKVGDRVLTHRGRFMPVLNTFIKPVEEMYEVTFSNGEVLRCTEKHKLLTDRNGWASLRHVCIKKTLGRWPTKDDSGKPLSFLIRDYVSALKKYGPDYCNSINNSSGGHTEPRIEGVESNKILSIKDGRQEPDAWKEAQELYWRQVGFKGIPYAGGRWETLLRSSDCFCGESGAAPERPTSGLSGSSYRREPTEQLSGQSCFGDTSGALPDTRALREKRLPVVITAVHPCGSYPVYDIEVAVDHSYQAAGCFSHNSASPNGQNFPKRGKLAKAYRSIFKAREGYVFLECDLSQAELRLAAWESGDPVMLSTYRNGGDIHRATAASTMKLTMDEFNKLDKETIDFKRFCAKAVNFGYVYGMGWRGFKVYAKTNYGVDYSEEEAQESRELYFKTFSHLPEWHQRRIREVNANGFVRSLHGAIRHLPSVYSNDPAIKAMAERQAINAPIQQFASDIGIMAMYRIARDCDKRVLRPIGFIHDAVLLEVREDMAEELARNVKFYMESIPFDRWFGIEPPLPILADASIGKTLSSMNELKGIEALRPEWYRPDNDSKNYWEFF